MVKQTLLLRWFVAITAAIIVVRLISLGLFPLFDTTEARYGEIARIMFETQNWVTPQIDYNVPFWGKPPMYTWISALSFSAFGVSEISARLPHFLVGLSVLALMYWFVCKVATKANALFTVFILSTTLGFIVASGMVMTDTLLLFATVLAMVSFWMCFKGPKDYFFGHVFFVALCIGMLAKGPVAVVIIGIALVSWSMFTKQFVPAISSLPWLTGTLLFLILTLPWYLWAELRTPGFIDYFIIGEHFQRFIESGWQGDLYGSAHEQPKGAIWGFWLAAAFPWSFVFVYELYKKYQQKKSANQNLIENTTQPINKYKSGLSAYLLAWIVAPMLLFTLAGNILPIYVLPGFGALAIYLGLYKAVSIRLVYVGGTTFALLVLVLSAYVLGMTTKSSEAELLGSKRQFNQQSQLFYWIKRPFSAQFYSKGQAQLIKQHAELKGLLNEHSDFYLAMTHKEFDKVSAEIENNCNKVNSTRKRTLLLCNSQI